MSQYMTFFRLGSLNWKWFFIPFETIANSRASSNFTKSMLAPLNTHTTRFPFSKCFTLSRPAIANAPEGSQITPCEYNFIIFSANFIKLTSTNPSTEVHPMLTALLVVDVTEDPSQNRHAFSALTNSPLRIDSEYGLHISGSTAMILVLGLSCLMTLAIDETSPPPPAGTKIKSMGFFFWDSTISLAMVANPQNRVRVSKDFRMGSLCSSAYLLATSLHSSQLRPT